VRIGLDLLRDERSATGNEAARLRSRETENRALKCAPRVATQGEEKVRDGKTFASLLSTRLVGGGTRGSPDAWEEARASRKL